MDTGRVVPPDGGVRPQAVGDGRRQRPPGANRKLPQGTPRRSGEDEEGERQRPRGNPGRLDLFA